MGMYTELVFSGQLKKDIPRDIYPFIDYFFNPETDYSRDALNKIGKPGHEFFECQRWHHIGFMCSCYFTPLVLNHIQNHPNYNFGNYVFLKCDLKNYDQEIQKFLNRIDAYMNSYHGYFWYEEFDSPETFKVFNGG